MLLTYTKIDTLFMKMKKELEKRTGYPFIKDTDWCFSLKVEGEVRTFELYYEFEHSVLFLNLSEAYWESEEGEPLAHLLAKSILAILEEEGVDCFFQIEGALHIDDVMEKLTPYVPEFPYVPIGKKAETLLTLLEGISLKKSYYQNTFFLKKELVKQYDLEVVPCLLDTPKLLLLEKRDHDNKAGDPSAKNLFATISSKEEYEALVLLWKEREEKVAEIKTCVFDYAEKKGNPPQKRERDYFVFAEGSYRFELYFDKSGHIRFEMYEVGYFTFASKEEAVNFIQKILDILDGHQKRFVQFLQETEEVMDTTFYEKSSSYKFYIGNEMEYVSFRPYFEIDSFTMAITPRYRFEYKKERLEFTEVETMFTEALRILKTDDRKVRLPNLYDDRAIDHLPKLCFELGVKEAHVPLPMYGEVKMELKNYYQDKQRLPLDPRKEKQQIGSIVVIKKDVNNIGFEKAV